ncbi:MAG: histidine phosphatase family protein [Pseudomonadota bacterium]
MRWIALCLLLSAQIATADDWEALAEPGTLAIMRHALAPGTGDPADFTLGDCRTQRNLDARGQQQARAIGAAFRERGIGFDSVLTSQWCRTRETADLLDLGPVSDAVPLNSFFRDRSGRARQTADTRALIDETEGRAMLVTHQVNISALTGEFTRSGEVLVIRPDGDSIEVVGRIMVAP